MAIPNLKRLKVTSLQDLESRLKDVSVDLQVVMVTTTAQALSSTHVNSGDINQCIRKLGWTHDKSYTLIGGLIGQLIKR